MTYPLSFTRTLIQLTNHTFLGSTVAGAAACLLLGLTGVQVRGLPKIACSLVGLGVAAVGYRQYLDNKKLTEIGQDLGIVERKANISWYSSLLSSPANVSVQIPSEPTAHTSEPMQDIIGYWQAQDKHLLVVGGTGAGKSYFVQAFCSELQRAAKQTQDNLGQWNYKLYDTDCTCDDWAYLRSLPTCALYESFSEVERQMQADLRVIEQRTVERKQAGDKWKTERTLIVAEELPALVDECGSTKEWVRKQAKRGRRVKRFICLVAQNDTVSNLGLEGDSKLRDSCFVRVYLGQSAIDRARQLKDTRLIQALENGGKSLCLVDDVLAVRPRLQQFPQTKESGNAVTLMDSQSSTVPESSEDTENRQNKGFSELMESSEPHIKQSDSPLTNLPELSDQTLTYLRQKHKEGISIQQLLLTELGQKKGRNWGRKVAWLTELLNNTEDAEDD